MSIADRLIKIFKAIFKALTLSCLLLAFSADASSVFNLEMHLYVPQVYDNTASLGYRKYKTQKFKGSVEVADDGATTVSLTNLSYKVGNTYVTYGVVVDEAVWSLIGNNKTGVFNTPSICLSIEALPSYIKTYQPTTDESLVLVLAGRGTLKSIRGYAAGTLGCGCAWYGHTSPTRSWIDCSVVDRASVYGTFTLRRKK